MFRLQLWRMLDKSLPPLLQFQFPHRRMFPKMSFHRFLLQLPRIFLRYLAQNAWGSNCSMYHKQCTVCDQPGFYISPTNSPKYTQQIFLITNILEIILNHWSLLSRALFVASGRGWVAKKVYVQDSFIVDSNTIFTNNNIPKEQIRITIETKTKFQKTPSKSAAINNNKLIIIGSIRKITS